MKRLAAWLTVFALLSLAPAGWAALRTEEIQYKQGDTELRGHLAYDDAVLGKMPCVLVVHEWWGLNDYAKRRADQLARLGYLAFALDMYGGGKNTTHPKEAREMAEAVEKNFAVGQARFLAALEVVRQHPLADPTRVAAIGYCFGGTVVLEMARRGVDLKGVVSFHGGLAPVDPTAPRNIKAKVLVCQGADDPFAPPKVVEAFEDEMRKAGADWQVNVYGGAKHSFTNPDAGKLGMAALAYDASADRRSWAAMRIFLDEIFAEGAR